MTLPSSGSSERFGYEWHRYSDLLPEYEEQFRRWTAHLSPDDWRGRTFLDVGCGMGRNSYWPMTYGAAGGLAIDLDPRSVHAAQKTLDAYRNVTVENRSAYDIGRDNEFDIVFSIGVIHHLERPDLALCQMVRAAKPGGLVLIWVYGLENNEWVVRVLNPLRKAVFSRLPISITHHLSLYPAAVLWGILRLGVGKIEYLRLVRQMKFSHLRSIVFDQMLPTVANYWPRPAVERLMRDSGLHDVKLIWINEMSWSAIGTKQ